MVIALSLTIIVLVIYSFMFGPFVRKAERALAKRQSPVHWVWPLIQQGDSHG